jgi:hypothetical protein
MPSRDPREGRSDLLKLMVTQMARATTAPLRGEQAGVSRPAVPTAAVRAACAPCYWRAASESMTGRSRSYSTRAAHSLPAIEK